MNTMRSCTVATGLLVTVMTPDFGRARFCQVTHLPPRLACRRIVPPLVTALPLWLTTLAVTLTVEPWVIDFRLTDSVTLVADFVAAAARAVVAAGAAEAA